MESGIQTSRELVQRQKSWLCTEASINLITDSKGHGFSPMSVPQPIPR